jgi:hypothetical protein
MYNVNYTCIYNKTDIFLKEEEDNLSEDDKDDIRDELYRNDMLHILDANDIENNNVDKELHNLYERIKSCDFLVECMTELAGRWISEDKEFGLLILYSFDYMYAMHLCVCDYLEEGIIEDDNVKLLRGLIWI